MFWGDWLFVIYSNIHLELLAFCMVETLGNSINNNLCCDSTYQTVFSEEYAWIISNIRGFIRIL